MGIMISELYDALKSRELRRAKHARLLKPWRAVTSDLEVSMTDSSASRVTLRW
jgi:hypothetical protein